VLKRLGAEAPRLDINIHNRPWSVYEGLENNSFDLALGAFSDAPATTRVRTLLHDDFVCLVRRGHPAVRKRLSLQRYVTTAHVVIGIGQPGPTSIDRALAKRKLTRRVALRVPSFLAAAVVVAESDLMLTLPRRLAEQVRRLAPLELHAPPLPLERFHFHLAWHVRRQDEPAHRWLRGLLGQVASAL
jgi:DNA-binding transcriptional LysR family regulator